MINAGTLCRSFLLAIVLTAIAAVPAATQHYSTNSAEDSNWSIAPSLSLYLFEDTEEDFAIAVLRADKGHLHLEGRFNYEDKNTLSFWGGVNLVWDKELIIDFTPIAGLVIGQTAAAALGFELSAGYDIIDIYSESEYLFNLENSGENFAYTWTELGVSPLDFLRIGLVAQRTRQIESGPDIQRGFFANITLGKLNLTGYFFNPGIDGRFIVAAAAFEL